MDSGQTFAPSGPDNEPGELDGAGQVQAFTQPLDDPLDEIDSVFETNAGAFAQDSVQKGGQ